MKINKWNYKCNKKMIKTNIYVNLINVFEFSFFESIIIIIIFILPTALNELQLEHLSLWVTYAVPSSINSF